MVASSRRKAERALAFASAQSKSQAQKAKNSSKPTSQSTYSQPKTSKSKPLAPQTAPEKKHRFILFIGNLPFSATTAQIKKHFSSVNPSSIRHSTDKTSGKSKGFAFLEFDDYARMDVCLRTFHHSFFVGEGDKKEGDGDAGDAGDEGKEEGENEQGKGKRKRSEGRRINVELTVGGGGSKSNARKDKLKAKNEKLHDERRQRAIAAGKERKSQRKPAPEKTVDAGADQESHIHPSRRSKVTQ